MIRVIQQKRYNTETASHIADNEFSDGANRLQRGRGTTLYVTKKGAYFLHYETQWQGEHDHIEPVGTIQAQNFFESAHRREVSFENAFPNTEVVDA